MVSIALFALIAQPFYGLVASQVANAATTVSSQAELVAAIASSETEINLGASFTTTSQININRTLVLNGNNFTISPAFTGSPSNDSALAVVGGAPAINNLIIEGIAAVNVQGIQVWESAATLNNITSRNNDKAGIHANKSPIKVHNVTTASNGTNFGGILISGSGTVVVTGQSRHTEPTRAIWQEGSASSYRVTDSNAQYTSANVFFGRIYILKTAPLASTIVTPTEGQVLAAVNPTITWTGVANAATYTLKVNGADIAGLTGTSYLSALGEGTHTVQVQAVAASGLASAWSPVRTFTITLPDTTAPEAPVITNSPVYVNASQPNNQATWSHSGSDVDRFEYREYLSQAEANADIDGATASYWIQTRAATERSQTVGQSWTGVQTLYYRVVAIDAAGNRSVPSALGTVIIDKNAPTISWQLQPNPIYGSAQGFHVRPITSEVGTIKTVYIDTVAPANVAYTSTGDHKNLDVSNTQNQALWNGLAEGEHVFIAVFTDYAGNTTTSNSNTFIIDRTAPTVTIKPSPDTVGGSGFYQKVSFKLYDKYKVDYVTINGVKKDLSDNVWSDVNNVTPGVFGAVEGSNTIIACDVAGNCSAPLTFILDTKAPVVSIDSPANGAVVSGSVPIVITATDVNLEAYSYRIRKVNADNSNTTDPAVIEKTVTSSTGVDGATVFTWDTSALGNGRYYVYASGRDKAGNRSEVRIYVTVNNITTPIDPIDPVDPVDGSGGTGTGVQNPAVPTPLTNNSGTTPLPAASLSTDTVALVTTTEEEDVTIETTAPVLETEEEGEVLGAEDSKNEWSLGNAVLAGITALLGLIALLGLVRRKDDSENNHVLVRVLTAVPLAAAVIAFFVIEDLSASMVWFNGWTLLFALVAVVQIVLFFASRRTTESQ